MKKESLQALKVTIDNWLKGKYYTYQKKNFLVAKSPIVEGEFRLKFTNEIHGFQCKGEQIQIFLVSKELHTTTLSNSPVSENSNSDNYRLQKLLKEFDEKFDEYVIEKLNECEETIFTTDHLFFT
jgi:hypothetical protein